MMNAHHASRGLRRLLTGLLALGWLSATARASAADHAPEAERAPEADGLGSHQRNVRMDVGLRSQLVKGSAFDAFSRDDGFHQFTTAASLGFWQRDRLSLAGVVALDYGKSSTELRSSDASLDALRFGLAPEARFHVLRVLALTAKVGPTLTREEASVESGLGSSLSKTAWRFGFDATAGAAVELWGYASGASRKPRLWLTGEAGYGWTAANRLRLKPTEAEQVPQRLAPLDLGDLSLGGPLFRITAALSFW